MPDSIGISAAAIKEAAQACSDTSRESCGLLAGRGSVITRVFPATNAAINPATSYEIALPELFQLVREIRTAGFEFLGTYHSHPDGKNEPSPRDIAWAYYPDVAYFIVSPLPAAPQPVRAFSIREGSVTELEIEIVPSEGDDR